MTEIAEKVAPSTDGQMKDITSVLVTAMPDHEVFDRKKMDYWSANKGLLKARIRHLLGDVPVSQDFPQDLKFWEQFYREVLKIKVDFSDIELPSYESVLRRSEIIPVVAELTTQEIIALLKENFPIPFSIYDKFPNILECRCSVGIVPATEMNGAIRRPSGHYGVLHRGGRHADLDMKIVSVPKLEDLDKDCAFSPVWNIPITEFPKEFMSPKEYLLFAAYSTWQHSALRRSIPWFDLSWEMKLDGTAFPVLSGNGISVVALGCKYSPGKFEIESGFSASSIYGRRVRVLSSLRKA
ncbi:MAG: hypothetical protein Q8P56_06105 [Candidatus Uhrbacteria bacterium]|nr:hypothetical protein [Candidatus Uhrbacteria bacterium]